MEEKSAMTRSMKSRKKKRNNRKLASIYLLIGMILGIAVGAIITIAISGKIRNNNEDLSKVEEQQKEDVVSSVEELLKEDSFAIETPIVNLYYPKQWKEQINIKQIDEELDIVQFWATIEGKEDVQIFDIVFGGEEGYCLGNIDVGNSEKVSIYVHSYELELGESWTEKEKEMIYRMAEDVNYLIGMLQKESGFVPAS